MPSQIYAPVPVAASQRKGLQLLTSADLVASLNATLATPSVPKYNGNSTRLSVDMPYYTIPEDDYTVPAPPPPSPVSFRSENWPTAMSVAKNNGVSPVCH
ncbi:hypothetical protein CMQ_1420 [Grosmannia clavigera kw1407]|uniref:Uncharacterized protein n=1 Tax=Grosmannia clavigera (strain kw1407 / UAMH 11150) TaxID=655863 RepID=F0XDK0_GROCL|nr:uncharacterized protein CMQ_1420 [Grosmannia clavigera kw1407]EFX04492.1 hypothetical protein CMQ_1420 [Grosmannia clavigera kw1407]